MLDLLEDYLDYRHYKNERIDGTVPWRERQVLCEAEFFISKWRNEGLQCFLLAKLFLNFV
jgi:SNF2 family DNA or RNA helicase